MLIGTPASFAIVERLQGAGFKALYAGGAVRDMLLGLTAHDVDIATDARPEQVRALFPKTVDVGARFGVIIVVADGDPYELATFRTDGAYLDGRRPATVTFATDVDDARRRDFTINGMFYDPVAERLIDHVGGTEDLRARVVRAIGSAEERFCEDRLRMMRAVRLAARLSFEIEAPVIDALRRFAPEIRSVSKERIRDEIVKILTEGHAERGVRLLHETGLLEAILPEAAAMAGVAQPPEFHPEGDVLEHTLLALSLMHQPTESLAVAVLLHDVGKPPTFQVRERIRFDGHDAMGAGMADRILRDLRFSNETREKVTALIREHLKFLNAPQMRMATLKRFLSQDNFAEHMELHRIDCLASHGKLDHYEFCKTKLLELPPEEIRPPRLVTGGDLIGMGHKPGPAFSTILGDVEEAQLEGRIRTRDEALQYVSERWPFDAPR